MLGIGLSFLCLAGLHTAHAKEITNCNNYTQDMPADFLFIIDASGSMCPYINQIETTLQKFVDELTYQKVDAVFSIVAFGDMPELILPFTSNATLTQQTLANIGCAKGGQEAGFEVIRMSLAANNGSDFQKSCVSPYTASSSCNLKWRNGTKKHIILATDEDSDIPYTSKYTMPNQPPGLCALTYSDNSGKTCSGGYYIEPPFQPRVYWSTGRQFFRNSSTTLTLDPIYQQELDKTVQVVLENAVAMSLLIKSDFNANRNGPISNWDSTSRYFNTYATNKAIVSNIHTSTLQYGDPKYASEDATTFENFNGTTTLNNLIAAGLGSSFQAKILASGGSARVFRIQDIIDPTLGQNVIENIYSAIAVFVKNCSLTYVPDDVTSTSVATVDIQTKYTISSSQVYSAAYTAPVPTLPTSTFAGSKGSSTSVWSTATSTFVTGSTSGLAASTGGGTASVGATSSSGFGTLSSYVSTTTAQSSAATTSASSSNLYQFVSSTFGSSAGTQTTLIASNAIQSGSTAGVASTYGTSVGSGSLTAQISKIATSGSATSTSGSTFIYGSSAVITASATVSGPSASSSAVVPPTYAWT
ncbi:hypothetical protein HDU97_006862, partial [Phlyctochytrium planicorne]